MAERVRAYTARGNTEGVAVSKECASENCQNRMADDYSEALCGVCQSQAHLDALRGLAAFERVLCLEAEFVQWCADNGQPHPHE